MEKTAKNLLDLLQEFVDQKCKYENVIKGLKNNGWENFLLFVKEPIEHSRSKFIWIFERENGDSIEIMVLTTHAFKDEACYCFLMIGSKTYQIAPPGSTSIKNE